MFSFNMWAKFSFLACNVLELYLCTAFSPHWLESAGLQ